MGHAYADIELSNPRQPETKPVHAHALADSGALMLSIPEQLAAALQLETESYREVTLADGGTKTVRYVGPVRVAFGNRSCFVGALVMGDQVLLGAVPMEDMDLIISPSRRSVTANPASPDVPRARA